MVNRDDDPMWMPTAEQVAAANLTRFIDEAKSSGAAISDFDSLYRWSIDSPEAFWPLVWSFCDVKAERRGDGRQWDSVLIGRERMAPPDPHAGPTWFTGARLNFAENLLRFADDREALVAWTEDGLRRRMTYAELQREVAVFAAALRNAGVVVGDRVAGFIPNTVEAVVAMLATAALGAVWTSCSPDFGVA